MPRLRRAGSSSSSDKEGRGGTSLSSDLSPEHPPAPAQSCWAPSLPSLRRALWQAAGGRLTYPSPLPHRLLRARLPPALRRVRLTSVNKALPVSIAFQDFQGMRNELFLLQSYPHLPEPTGFSGTNSTCHSQ